MRTPVVKGYWHRTANLGGHDLSHSHLSRTIIEYRERWPFKYPTTVLKRLITRRSGITDPSNHLPLCPGIWSGHVNKAKPLFSYRPYFFRVTIGRYFIKESSVDCTQRPAPSPFTWDQDRQGTGSIQRMYTGRPYVSHLTPITSPQRW